MPAYGFKPHFVEKTLVGLKPHTIRAPRADGRVPKVGEAFHAYCGMRSPACTWLWSSTTTQAQPIVIGPYEHGNRPLITVDGQVLDHDISPASSSTGIPKMRCGARRLTAAISAGRR